MRFQRLRVHQAFVALLQIFKSHNYPSIFFFGKAVTSGKVKFQRFRDTQARLSQINTGPSGVGFIFVGRPLQTLDCKVPLMPMHVYAQGLKGQLRGNFLNVKGQRWKGRFLQIVQTPTHKLVWCLQPFNSVMYIFEPISRLRRRSPISVWIASLVSLWILFWKLSPSINSFNWEWVVETTSSRINFFSSSRVISVKFWKLFALVLDMLQMVSATRLLCLIPCLHG